MDIPSSDYDYITLRNIRLPIPIALESDAWGRPGKAQPTIISLRLPVLKENLRNAANNDSVEGTLNYSTVYKTLERDIQAVSDIQEHREAAAPIGIALGVIEKTAYRFGARGETSETLLHLPKALLRASGGLKCFTYSNGEKSRREYRIEDMRCYCIIGVNDHERLQKQAVDVSLILKYPPFETSKPFGAMELAKDSIQEMTNSMAKMVEESSYQTVEALALAVAKRLHQKFLCPKVTVKIEKPSALPFVEQSGVEITRTYDEL